MKTETFYVLRAKDSFGDTWPLANSVAGIDGERHETLSAAQAVAKRYGSDKAMRVELRGRNGWQQGTIRGLEILEVSAS